MDIALKEWAVVCDLMVEGSLSILLRKGGIHESGGPGVFELEHPRFLLFPSWMHQKPAMVKERFRERVVVMSSEPGEVTFKGVGEAAKIWRVKSRAAFDALDDLHPWTAEQIDMRFNYKPQNPLYLMAVRVARLPRGVTTANHAEYAGCKSWVPLRPGDAVDTRGATPAVDDAAFAALLERLDRTMA